MTVLGFPRQPVSAIAAEATELVVLGRLAVEKLLEEIPIAFLQNLSRGSIQRLQSSNSASLRDIELVLGSIVHDLKNPINVAMNAADMIDQGTDAKVATTTGLIKRSCTRMLALVQDVLDAARGKTTLRIETVDVQELLRELDELIVSRIRSKGIKVVTDINFDGEFRGDARATARALANIIKNAGEAMRPGGTLTIATNEVDGHIAFGISDTGTGIPPQVLSGLFDPLVTYGKEGGSGFGMTITKMIAEGHGGRVHLVETSERGTTFEMHLPLTESQSQLLCDICGKPARLVREFPSIDSDSDMIVRCPEHEREDDYT
jgi:signal transduction histidine kinase